MNQYYKGIYFKVHKTKEDGLWHADCYVTKSHYVSTDMMQVINLIIEDIDYVTC